MNKCFTQSLLFNVSRTRDASLEETLSDGNIATLQEGQEYPADAVSSGSCRQKSFKHFKWKMSVIIWASYQNKLVLEYPLQLKVLCKERKYFHNRCLAAIANMT